MFDDDRTERVEECSMCGDEACVCSEVCDICNGWKARCGCQEKPAPTIACLCADCREVRDPEITTEYKDGAKLEFKHCSECGSDRVTPIDELTDKESG